MKIALTGHRNGLGKCLSEMLLDSGHEVVGFDILEGYDINFVHCREDIIEKSKDCDVFINNAYSSPGQFELLRMLINLNIHSIVMNVGSNVTNLSKEILDADPDWNRQVHHTKYLNHKKLQDDYIHKVRQQERNVPMTLTIKPGWLNTTFTDGISLSKCIDVKHVCKTMIFQIEMATKRIWIPDITIVAENGR